MKKKDAIKAILAATYESWIFQRKSKNVELPNCVQPHDKITHIFVCPMRHEIVGGQQDGRTGYFPFMFNVNKFIKICKTQGLLIKDIILCSRGKKQFECPTLAFEIKSQRSTFILHVFTTPAKAMTMTMKIKRKNHRSV